MTDKRWDDGLDRVEPRVIHNGTRHVIWLDVTPHGTCICACDVQRVIEERDAEIARLNALLRVEREACDEVRRLCDLQRNLGLVPWAKAHDKRRAEEMGA